MDKEYVELTAKLGSVINQAAYKYAKENITPPNFEWNKYKLSFIREVEIKCEQSSSCDELLDNVLAKCKNYYVNFSSDDMKELRQKCLSLDISPKLLKSSLIVQARCQYESKNDETIKPQQVTELEKKLNI